MDDDAGPPLPPATTFEELDAKLDAIAASGGAILATQGRQLNRQRWLLWALAVVAAFGLMGSVLGVFAVHANCVSINHDRRIHRNFWNHYVDEVTRNIPRDAEGQIIDPDLQLRTAQFRMDIDSSYRARHCRWIALPS